MEWVTLFYIFWIIIWVGVPLLLAYAAYVLAKKLIRWYREEKNG